MLSKEKSGIIIKVFLVLFSVAVSMVLGVAISKTQHNIAWYKITFVTAVFLIFMTVLYLIIKGLEFWIIRYERKLLLVICVLWGISLYIVSCIVRNSPIADYFNVWKGAAALISGGEVNWWYFALWKNNFILMLFLAVLMAFSNLIGMTDSFYLILFVVTLMTVWTGICIYRMVRLAGMSAATRFFALFLFIGFVPIWGGRSIFILTR